VTTYFHHPWTKLVTRGPNSPPRRLSSDGQRKSIACWRHPTSRGDRTVGRWRVRPAGDDVGSPVTTCFSSPAGATRHRPTEPVTVACRSARWRSRVASGAGAAVWPPAGDGFGRRV